MLGQEDVVGFGREKQFAMPHAAVLARDLVAPFGGDMVESGIRRLALQIDFGHRPSHAGAAKRHVATGMATATTLAAYIASLGLGIQERTRGERRHRKGI